MREFYICFRAKIDISKKYFEEISIPKCIELSLKAGDYIVQVCVENENLEFTNPAQYISHGNENGNDSVNVETAGIIFHRIKGPPTHNNGIEFHYDFSSPPNLASTFIVSEQYQNEIAKFDHRMAQELRQRNDLFSYYKSFEKCGES